VAPDGKTIALGDLLAITIRAGNQGRGMGESHAMPVPVEADDRMFCYRHPDRETWVRCGRCDRPICVKCSIQGPVGFRCRDCGLMKNDPLTTFRPVQLALAVAVSVLAGTVAGLVASQIGFFSVVVSYFAGGLIVEAVRRVVGYKHGPVMLAIVFGGIVVGSLLGLGYEWLSVFGSLPAEAAAVAGPFLQQQLLWALIGAGAACAGAYSRLR
jgi:hypothetical protein